MHFISLQPPLQQNLNTGLSGWCDWEIVEGCASVNCSGRCDINVDLERQLPPSVSGDPHFVGFRGQRYDFHGVADGVFNLITDTNFHLNARFVNADLRHVIWALPKFDPRILTDVHVKQQTQEDSQDLPRRYWCFDWFTQIPIFLQPRQSLSQNTPG